MEHSLQARRAVGRSEGQAAPIRLLRSRAASSSGCASRARWRWIPEVLLLDEPCSALDPIATAKIEDLLFSLKDQCTQVIVTHNMQQAARVADFTGFFLLGKLIEFDKTEMIFKRPAQERNRRLHHGPVRLDRCERSAGGNVASLSETNWTNCRSGCSRWRAWWRSAIHSSVDRAGGARRAAGQRGAVERSADQSEGHRDRRTGHASARAVSAHGPRHALPHRGHQDQRRPGAHGRPGREYHRARPVADARSRR